MGGGGGGGGGAAAAAAAAAGAGSHRPCPADSAMSCRLAGVRCADTRPAGVRCADNRPAGGYSRHRHYDHLCFALVTRTRQSSPTPVQYSLPTAGGPARLSGRIP